MSFAGYKERIEYRDTVIIYMGYESMIQFEVQQGKVHQTKFGALKHDALIGVLFGSKVECAKGFVHVLHPTPELWTVNLPHRTQILYSTDISVITLQLELKPGSVVVESGTGSASLSHSILRTIAPNGHLHTFDFHEVRVEKAREEFERHGLGDLVTIAHRDVCKDGFALETIANAVFLDLPAPWEALPFAKRALLPGGRICSFSPCIEQVERACITMRDLGFTEIRTMECLLRPLDARTMVVPMPDLGYGPGKSYASENQPLSVAFDKPVVGHVEIESRDKKDSRDKFQHKKLKLDKVVLKDVSVEERSLQEDEANGKKCSDGKELTLEDHTNCKASYVFKTAMPPLQMPGHTGYLTFATLYP